MITPALINAAKINAQQAWGEPHVFDCYDRTETCVWARTFVAWTLRSNGATLQQTGNAISRHHASVLNLLDKMRFALDHPGMFADVMRKYDYYTKSLEYDLHH